jgi:hypothetical protein
MEQQNLHLVLELGVVTNTNDPNENLQQKIEILFSLACSGQQNMSEKNRGTKNLVIPSLIAITESIDFGQKVHVMRSP